MRVRVYLKNSNSQSYTVVRKALYPLIQKIEYTNNVKGNDYAIDCTYLNKDTIGLHIKEILTNIEEKYKLINKTRCI